MAQAPASGMQQLSIWDGVTRLWHWAFAFSVSAGWLLGRFRDFETVQWHFYAGYVTGLLLLWRLIWGFTGPEPIRFVVMLKGLKALPAYIASFPARQPGGTAGHNPLGVLSVFAMLLLLSLQVLTGLFVEDDTLFAAGPLAYDIDSDLGKRLASLHRLNAKLILALVGLHLAAILFYRLWKKEDLIRPMLTGRKWVRRDS